MEVSGSRKLLKLLAPLKFKDGGWSYYILLSNLRSLCYPNLCLPTRQKYYRWSWRLKPNSLIWNCWWSASPNTWRIIPISTWFVTNIYRPSSPFGGGRTLLRGHTNHGLWYKTTYYKWNDAPSTKAMVFLERSNTNNKSTSTCVEVVVVHPFLICQNWDIYFSHPRQSSTRWPRVSNNYVGRWTD